MRLSEINKQKLYQAITAPITKMRIKELRIGSGNNLDNRLILLETEICQSVVKALNIELTNMTTDKEE